MKHQALFNITLSLSLLGLTTLPVAANQPAINNIQSPKQQEVIPQSSAVILVKQEQRYLRYTFAGLGDWDGDGHQDLVAKDTEGLLWLYPGDSKRGYSRYQRVQVGNGWNEFTFAGLGDWDGDGHQDLVAKDANGLLWLYPGDSKRGYSRYQRVQVGNGWNEFTFAGLGDWDGDGHQDLVAKDANGLLWLYPGDSKRGYSRYQRVQVGNGWNEFTFAGLGDWDGDGHQDLVAKDANGLLWLYPGDSKRGYSRYQRVQVGNGWNEFTFAGLGDWDGDGHQDLVAKDANGLLWLYPGDSKRGYSRYQRVQVGNGW